ncbi:MAG: fumarylacetoacetase [Phycisphaeraceae bacterium]|nr:fumarylacetoacetase [Phycisphaeraceae bacterium]MBX3366293.1 fumarylacetoacetase [Phycisphaeraceae bacterium]
MTSPHSPRGTSSGSGSHAPHTGIDETHDPNLRSWVESANDPNTDFPIQNLPFCAFTSDDLEGTWSFGLRIGESILDLEEVHRRGLTKALKSWNGSHFAHAMLNDIGLPKEIRSLAQSLLGHSGKLASAAMNAQAGLLIDASKAQLMLPMDRVPNYTDFYASIHHATNVGSMFRPDNALLPNYKHIPIGYHGRGSSIVPSGTSFHRPVGQTSPPDSDPSAGPGFGPCKLMDYELEMGCIIGRGNALGSPVSIADAESHIFGLCIVNDWSARDLQKWEYVPLGPFLAKNFATTISPYIVTMEALAPFRIPAYERPASDPRPLPYLTSEANTASGGFDITLEVHLQSAEMAKRSMSPVRLSKGNFKHMYWTFAQMVAHHTVNGCNLQPGDLLASGTISGPTRDSRGSMIELTWDGDPFANPPKLVPGTQRTPIELPTGEKRTFLADGDTVIMKAYCEREGFRRIGFGECRGTVLPART